MTKRTVDDADFPVTDPEDRDALLAVLRLIAERAGKAILAYYVEGGDIEVRRKEDASPVTDADQAAEDFILEALGRLTPDIPIVSEEASAAGHTPDVSGGRFWLVDPLDGTKEFLSHNGEFTVNIALIEAGRPVAGVVHAPALAMTWVGAGPNSATFSETDHPPMPIRVRSIPQDGATVIASRRHGAGPELEGFLSGHKVKDRLTAGSSLKFCLVATGRASKTRTSSRAGKRRVRTQFWRRFLSGRSPISKFVIPAERMREPGSSGQSESDRAQGSRIARLTRRKS
jgi:3'(2'), 5'-bisphosphate nucleotidase